MRSDYKPSLRKIEGIGAEEAVCRQSASQTVVASERLIVMTKGLVQMRFVSHLHEDGEFDLIYDPASHGPPRSSAENE